MKNQSSVFVGGLAGFLPTPATRTLFLNFIRTETKNYERKNYYAIINEKKKNTNN